jgi:hypothetical protein
MKRLAIRSVWNNDLPPAVRVVTKKVREHPVALIGAEGREGFASQGLKPSSFCIAFGTTKVVP